MTKPIHRRPRHLLRAVGAVALLGFASVVTDAHGDSAVQFMTAKSLPDATVDVIDPESGTSTGTGGSDVNLAVGDIILFRFAVASAPSSGSSVHRGVQSYVTEYVPPGTELVGARLVDAFGNTIEPRPAGLALDGCAGGSLCNTPPAGLQSGSIAQVYADTGIFYSTSLLSGSPIPVSQFLTLNNGVTMTEEPGAIDPSIVQVLNDVAGPWFAHNDWDYDQVLAFGAASSTAANQGDGNTPFGYGSPVAGPQTFYPYEVTATGQLNSTIGPWNRVLYPGSQIGTGVANIGSTSNMTRVGVDTATGWDLTPANPRSATAVRFAMGEAQVGELRFVEVALRVTSVPIDPSFGTGAGNVDCGEAFGTDASSRAANSGGANNPWPTFVPHPQCVFLRLKFDIQVDKDLALGDDVLNYDIFGKNLAVTTENNARVIVKFIGSDQTFISSTPMPTATATCTAPGETDRICLTYDLGALAPSDEFDIDLQLSSATPGKRTAVVLAQYTSTELLAIDSRGFTSTAMTVVAPTAAPRIVLNNVLDVTSNFAASPSNTWQIAGTVTNAGTTDWTSSSFTIVLPSASYGLRNAAGTAANQITVGGVNFSCGTTGIERVCNAGQTYAVLGSRAIGFRLVVPAGEAGLKTIGIRTFGDAFETNFPKAVTVPVGAVRTVPPVLECPIVSTQPAISGTSEALADVRVLFNLMQRGTATASDAGAASPWSSSDFTGFGERYGGLEATATAQAPGELQSERSAACFVTASRACSDGFDNDGDGVIDFPADPGCTSPTDSDESDPPPPQCSDGINNDGANGADWPADPSCDDPTDTSEDGVAGCADGLDNDGDGFVDFDGPGLADPDPDCGGSPAGRETTLRQCQDGIDNDVVPDGLVDFPDDEGCHSLFDDDEFDAGSSTADTKPRLLIALDSSGSMNWNTCADVFTGGDGSTECPGGDVGCATCDGGSCGNATPDDSRLFQVKAGLSNVVAAFGEVEYSLMRFHQNETSFSCPTAAASLESGGWQGGGIAPCGGGFAAGDLLVSFAQDNEPTILDWMNHDSDYGAGTPPIGTDFEVRGSGTTPLAGILTSANDYLDDVRFVDLKRACRPYRVILVTDGAETCGGDPTAAAAALLADNAEVSVIGFATPDPVVISNLNAIAAAGGTGTAIFVDDEAALSAAIAQIIQESVLVERCNGLDDDCDGQSDEDFPDVFHQVLPAGPDDPADVCDNGQIGRSSVTGGACFQTGVFECVPIEVDPSQTTTQCTAPAVTPGTETCNQLDDDCDEAIDEGLAGCTCVPQPEICNGISDDCDAEIDEGAAGVGDPCGASVGECTPGTFVCTATGPGAAQLTCEGESGPVAEVCNSGDDDDCDGLIDEVFAECYEPADVDGIGCDPDGSGGFTCLGLCQSGGKTCSGDALGECIGDVHPVADVCNGLDDDCDGTADEGLALDGVLVGGTCDNGLEGVCFFEGVVVCTADGGLTCTAPVIPPGLEVCNNLDDDCNGLVDDALGDPIGDTCGGGACGSGEFICCTAADVADGTCDRAGDIECDTGATTPTEVCNGIDDDCDGDTDEFVTADPGDPPFGSDCVPEGFESFGGTGECTPGHLECVAGQADCRDYVGPAGEIPCNGIDEDCDGNDDQTCPGDLACTPLGCASPCGPGEFPCSFGFYCEEFDGLGDFCVVDPCADADCDPGFACDQTTGDCYDLCEEVNCPTGTVCTNGLCRDCFTLGCPDGELCVLDEDSQVGECEPEQCATITCGDGEFCRDGECIVLPTEPCPDGCPDGEVCSGEDGRCVMDQCVDVRCTDGEACNPQTGECVTDPCVQISCPIGYECVVTADNTGACFAPVSPPEETVFAGGGGCGCSTGDGDPDGSSLLLALGLMIGLRRRRRRHVRGAVGA